MPDNGIDDWIVPGQQQAPTGGVDDWITPDQQAPAAAAPQRYQTWPERLARGLYRVGSQLFTAPHEAYVGQLNPLSDEAIARMAEGAMLVSPVSPGAMVTRAAAPAVSEALQAGARQGIEIPRYMAGETEVMPRVATALSKIPMAGEPIAASAQRVGEQLGQAAERIAPATEPAVAGEAARSGLLQTIKAKPGVSEAYEGIDELLHSPEARVPLSAASDEVSRIMAERANANIPGTSGAVNLLQNALADARGMNYAGIKALRSYLGEKNPQQLVAEGISPIEAKRLYGPLTEDLRSAVEAAGGQPALDAWEAANALARQSAQQRQQLYKIIGSRGEVSPESVFSRLTAMAGSKSSADIGRLQLAKQSMPPDAWQTLTSGVISKLGRDPQGQFSADRFLTGYSNIAPAARSVLFSPSQQAALSDLAAVSNLVRSKISRFANVSRTSDSLLAGGELMGLLYEPITTIKTIAGGRALSWLLTQPAVARAASNASRAGLVNNPAAQQQALAALRATIASAMARRREADAGALGAVPAYFGGGAVTGAPGTGTEVWRDTIPIASAVRGPENFARGGRVVRSFRVEPYRRKAG